MRQTDKLKRQQTTEADLRTSRHNIKKDLKIATWGKISEIWKKIDDYRTIWI